MKTLTIRNIPAPVYTALAESARAEHRSLQEQVRLILTNDVALRCGSVCEKAAEYRSRLAGRKPQKSVVQDLRQDRGAVLFTADEKLRKEAQKRGLLHGEVH